MEVEYLVIWELPENFLELFPRLRVIFSIGAGVDQFDLTEIPDSVQVVRMLDPGIKDCVAEYVALAALTLHRNIPSYLSDQHTTAWNPIASLPARKTRVGILGLGDLGQAAASRLQAIGFPVSGWSRSLKVLSGIESYSGDEGLSKFLSCTNILVCLLPLTDSTRGILCSALFNQLPRGACLVNPGRGEHLCEQDLLDSLDSGQIRAAMLDVFQNEPPKVNHPFWQHTSIIMTPHIAGTTQTDSGGTALLENVLRHRSGEAMEGEINRSMGY